jgi:hypothetical protein
MDMTWTYVEGNVLLHQIVEWNCALSQNTHSYIKLQTNLHSAYLQKRKIETVRIRRMCRMKLRVFTEYTK